VIRVTEKLANTERHLDISKNHALRAEDNTDELKKLNKSIFNPSAALTWNKEGKRAAKEAKIQARYDEDREERERGLMEVRETQNRIGGAGGYDRNEEGIGGGRQLTGAQQAMRKEQRSRFQFEATASDDEQEDELDDNLNEISDVTKKLKALGTSMGQELDTQNQRIDRISDKATGLDTRMYRNTERVSFMPNFLVFSLCSSPLAAQADQVTSPLTAFVGYTGYQKGFHHLGDYSKDSIPTVCFCVQFMGAFSISGHEFEAWTKLLLRSNRGDYSPCSRHHCTYVDWIPRWLQPGLKTTERSSRSGNAFLPHRQSGN